jgi:transcriptional regulator with XRE-family HTH domain
MVSREKRLHEVFEHLRKFFGIHTQTDFAVALKYSRVYISSALNGNEKNLTDKLFENICEAYPGVFNLHYLLTGEGDLLTLDEEVHIEEFEKQAASVKSSAPDSTTEQTYIMSKMLETLLKPIETAHAETVAALNQQITEKQSRIDDLERTIAAKEEIIRARDSRILELERRLAQSNADDLSKYPYTIGVAEERTNPQNKNV